MNDIVEAPNFNPFRNAPVVAAPQADAMVAVASAREVAEVQTSMLMARRFPRNEAEAMDRILMACARPTLAEGASYEYARGGTDIRGPSIRLAECLAGYWGHMDCGWRVIEERPGVTKIETWAWDLQTGSKWHATFDVTHERSTKNGVKALSDPRDIYEHCANAASRRMRACILRVIPKDVQDAAVAQCEATLRTKIEVTPERLVNLVKQFGEYGVTKAHLEQRIQRRLEGITPGMLVQLGKIWTSMKDGLSDPSNWFDMGAGDTPPASPEAPGAAPDRAPATNPRQAVRDRLQAQKRARQAGPTQEQIDAQPVQHLPPLAAAGAHPPSQALQDIIRFARAAVIPEDLERVRQIALQLDTEDEAILAQQHIDAAMQRVAAPGEL